jgi:hypothetical protein
MYENVQCGPETRLSTQAVLSFHFLKVYPVLIACWIDPGASG